MKFASPSFIGLFIASSSLIGHVTAQTEPLEFSDSIGMEVKKVGSVPTNTTAAWKYNMMPSDQKQLFFIDQKLGKIYLYSKDDEPVTKIWDFDKDVIPDGLKLHFPWGRSADTLKVQNIMPGKRTNEFYVVFHSATLPAGWNHPDAALPAPGAYPGYLCNGTSFIRDYYRIGIVPHCFAFNMGGLPGRTVYVSFYKYKLIDGLLKEPKAFFVLEQQLSPGHLGGGSVTLDDGRLLWGVGDCLPFGTEGMYAPQDDKESCGKILLIDPTIKGKYKIAAKGVRNTQQMRIVKNGRKKILVFADIGGVSAEEVNAIPLNAIINTRKIDNFGWGRNTEDGKAREGTFYVGNGSGGGMGHPPFEEIAPIPEPGFRQPWVQFGRTPTDFFFAIAGFAISDKKSFERLKLVWTEMNTGFVLATTEKYIVNKKMKNGPSTGYKIKLFNEEGEYLENGFNDLVAKELGVEHSRGDPRLFHYPDGTAGVFIERTGVFYRLKEITLLGR